MTLTDSETTDGVSWKTKLKPESRTQAVFSTPVLTITVLLTWGSILIFKIHVVNSQPTLVKLWLLHLTDLVSREHSFLQTIIMYSQI